MRSLFRPLQKKSKHSLLKLVYLVLEYLVIKSG